jgi:hypothetical protein
VSARNSTEPTPFGKPSKPYRFPSLPGRGETMDKEDTGKWIIVSRDAATIGIAADPAQDYSDSTILLDLWHIVRLEPLKATAPAGDSNGQ